ARNSVSFFLASRFANVITFTRNGKVRFKARILRTKSFSSVSKFSAFMADESCCGELSAVSGAIEDLHKKKDSPYHLRAIPTRVMRLYAAKTLVGQVHSSYLG